MVFGPDPVIGGSPARMLASSPYLPTDLYYLGDVTAQFGHYVEVEPNVTPLPVGS